MTKIKPMLAHNYEDYREALEFPVLIQPKLDGIRCITTLTPTCEGSIRVQMQTRTGKHINSVPHIIESLISEVEPMLEKSVILDGELYAHNLDFEEIVSIVRRKEKNISTSHKKISYHIYDICCDKTKTVERLALLNDVISIFQSDYIVSVKEELVENHEDLEKSLSIALSDGFEGIMIRTPASHYEFGKRSKNLLKYKRFYDDEYTVKDLIEGRGKMKGAVGAILCQDSRGRRFKVKMMGTFEEMREILSNASDYVGRRLVVRYQNLTAKGVPRFGMGTRFRENIDY